jgi:hypothetical protein
MSLSTGYPYSLREKFNYYSGKIFCFGSVVIGADLYSRLFFWKQPYLSNKEIKQMGSTELYCQANISREKAGWHFKSVIVGVCVVLPSALILRRYNLIPTAPKKLYPLLVSIGLLFLNGVYGIIAHTYNQIRIGNYLNLLKYGEIESEIDELLAVEKCTWNMIVKQDGNNTVHIIYNAYYKNLKFFFEMKETAEKFLQLLITLPPAKVDWMNENAVAIRTFQRDYLQNF